MAQKLKFIGLDTQYPTADGEKRTRLHLDGAASPLASTVATDTIQKMLLHYSNTHSHVHNSAQISTQALAWAHQQVLSALNADNDAYTAIFTGSGTTAAINRVARGLAAARPDKKVVLISAMEHHANDLPHRQFDNQVHYFPLLGRGANLGSVDLVAFENMCQVNADNLNYIAVSSVSNVTGIRNPIRELTEIAHRYGALVLVDAAQSVAHGPTEVSLDNPDFFVFSGHKIYTPMAPGVLIAKKSSLRIMSGQDLGGGSVSDVSFYDYQLLNDYPDREQSGTPNIVGAVALAKVLESLHEFGFKSIREHNEQLIRKLIQGLMTIDGLTIYGDPQKKRIGALAFNHSGINHGLLAAILNDYYGIAVRNECFCAHPYVSALIKESLWELDLSSIPEAQQQSFINRKRGMVRVSLSLYNTENDIDRLLAALKQLNNRVDDLRPLYDASDDGSYRHKTFAIDWKAELRLDAL